jgi:hypothetical protein
MEHIPVGQEQVERYLTPYRDAAAEFGAGFGALLWASPKTQRARFEAIGRACSLEGRGILDVGCGRADLLDYLLANGTKPAEYTGIEAIEQLAKAAEEKYPQSRILREDFVREPLSLFVGAQVVIFSGSLNTMEHSTFYQTLGHAWQSAGEAIVFNFLCSPKLAGKAYLFWHDRDDVAAFARALGGAAEIFDGYLDGDCTIAVRKPVDA